jgi:6-phosphogluconolactonase (cycloisomerase 2 family)
MVTDAVGGFNTIDAGGTTSEIPATPVSITVDPSGQFVYVANLFSDNVTVYSMDASGALTLVEHKPTGSGPSSVTVLAQ